MDTQAETKSGVIKSVVLHLIILAVLLISVSCSPDATKALSAPASVPVIKATFIDAQAIADNQRQKAQAEAQARAEAEKKRKAREAEAARQKRIAAQKEAKRKKAEAEARKQKELERLAAQKEKQRKEREAREKAEAERKKREAEQKAEMDKIMQEQMEAERAAQRQRRAQHVLTEKERYQALIQQTIMRYLIEDSSFKGKRCRLNIRLATTGLVTKVTIRDGDSALCRAAQSAVLRPDTLPMSSEPDVYEELKDINLTVEL